MQWPRGWRWNRTHAQTVCARTGTGVTFHHARGPLGSGGGIPFQSYKIFFSGVLIGGRPHAGAAIRPCKTGSE